MTACGEVNLKWAIVTRIGRPFSDVPFEIIHFYTSPLFGTSLLPTPHSEKVVSTKKSNGIIYDQSNSEIDCVLTEN